MTHVCICGGGALGHVMAAVLGNSGCVVSMLTARPQQWSQQIVVTDPNEKKYEVQLHHITSIPSQVIPQADIVLLCVPGYLLQEQLTSIRPYLTSQFVGSVVSSTGFFLFAHQLLPTATKLFGFQRVPFIARVDEYGKTASLLGYKNELCMAVENADIQAFGSLWTDWLNVPVKTTDNYLSVSLSNSNPILHPARLYGLWHDWHKGIFYSSCSYFYADWNDLSSYIYIACDKELQQLANKIGIRVTPVLEYYESVNAQSLTRKLSSIPAFQTIKAPMKSLSNGYVPDLQNRYFTEDFPYGLDLLRQLASQYSIATPTMDRVWKWYINLNNS